MRGAMAMDRSAAMDIPGARSNLSPEKDNLAEHPGAKKKKGFQPLKSLKKLFGGKKKGKKEEGVTGVGIKSRSNDALETHREGPSSSLAKTLSLSEDSIFTSDKSQNTSLDISRSMDPLPGKNFKDELVRKLHRRPDDDDGLPSSPPSHTTTMDALIENGLKDTSMSMNSEHSLMSMDSEAELEEEFFGKGWTAGVSKSPNVSDLGEGPVDLDVVSSTRSLNMTAAKHKIAIRPPAKRISAMPGQRRKNAASPKPAVIMPQLREESPSKTPVKEDISSKQLAEESVEEKLEVTEPVAPVIEATASKEELEPVVVVPDSVEDSQEKGDTEKHEEKHDWKPEKHEEKHEEKLEEKQEDIVIQPVEVVLRHKESPRVSVNSEEDNPRPESDSQPQAAAPAKSELTVFGERKTKRSSLVIENRNWDDIGKPKVKTPEEETEATGTEFASVFANIRKKSSQKKDGQDDEAEKDEAKRSSGSSVYKQTDKEVTTTSVTAKLTASLTSDAPTAKNVAPPVTSKTSIKPTATSQNKTVIIQKMYPAETKRNSTEKEKLDSVEKSKRDSFEKVKRISVEKGQSDSAEKQSRDSTEEKRLSAEKVKRKSVEKEKRESADESNVSVVNVVKGRRTSDKDPDVSGETTNRTSSDSGKRNSTEKDKSSTGGNVTKSTDTNNDSKVAKEKESKTVVIQKVSSKFVSVQEKSVPSNDTKADAVPSQPSSKTVSMEAAKSGKKTVQIVDKVQSEGLSKDAASSEEATTNKRDSPRPVNRLRSQTLPEQKVSKDLPSSSDFKRANSQEAGINKENVPAKSQHTASSANTTPSTSAANPSPQKSSAILRSSGSGRPDPQKIAKDTPKEGHSGQPSWIKLAQKHTDGWNEEKEKVELRAKSDITDEEKSAKRASVMDLMKRFQ